MTGDIIFFFGNGLIDDVIVIGSTDSDFRISRALVEGDSHTEIDRDTVRLLHRLDGSCVRRELLFNFPHFYFIIFLRILYGSCFFHTRGIFFGTARGFLACTCMMHEFPWETSIQPRRIFLTCKCMGKDCRSTVIETRGPWAKMLT